ncbi:MAG: hypothetical protein QXN55_07260 [Candidatus Nitrosotenuis sp.]
MKPPNDAPSFFNFKKIQSNVIINKKLIKKVFAKKIFLIKKLIDYQTRLTDLYFRQMLAKQQLSEVYHNNTVENSALLNQINLSYSIMMLIESGFHGSARVLLRQFFEFLLVGKFSEFDDGNILRKWESKINNNREFDINLSRDVLHKINPQKDIERLKTMWSTLSDVSHPTKYAQQIPPISPTGDQVEWLKLNYVNIHFTLDLFFMLLCMNQHLLTNHWGRKTRGWYMGYHKDPMEFWKKEKNFKTKIKTTISEYFQFNKQYKTANIELKKVIYQYKQKWTT